ncbi:hypothetical protein ACK32O_18940 [Aeromonas enteropelogenes]|uniref:hypothetical protein n=1 Tax=Aeromonas enteropelogenes TaxID=29489 RepID=UPI0039864DBC
MSMTIYTSRRLKNEKKDAVPEMMFGGEEELNIEFINVAINPNLTWKYWLKCHLYWILRDIFVLLRLERLFTPRPIFLLFVAQIVPVSSSMALLVRSFDIAQGAARS